MTTSFTRHATVHKEIVSSGYDVKVSDGGILFFRSKSADNDGGATDELTCTTPVTPIALRRRLIGLTSANGWAKATWQNRTYS
jgi:hypothetical protein